MATSTQDPSRSIAGASTAQQDCTDASESNPRVGSDVASENARWAKGLAPNSPDHDITVAKLYAILVKMAYTETRRKGARIHLIGPELDDIAHQAAADATITVCQKIATFRGDCKFTTWAYKFVAFDVSSKVNRHCWQRAHVSMDADEWVTLRADSAQTPELCAERSELVKAVERIVREDLTEKQQQAFGAIAIRGLPVSQVAMEMHSNPNAIYKVMFDARRKLRDGLTLAGYLSAQP